MNNKIKQEINKIDIPIEVSERSKIGVSKAKKEIHIGRKRYYATGIIVAASMLLSIGLSEMFNGSSSPNGIENNQNNPIVTEGGGVKIPNGTDNDQNAPNVNNSGGIKIPAIQLPENTSNADMIGLIVYNGKVYTQTDSEIDGENAKNILGEKLGTTKGSIDEWSKQKAYSEEFASTIGIGEVYSVKGYEKDFRLMTYGKRDGKPYADFYENLDGITINRGEDVFGKLKMVGNISTSKYRTFNDWNTEVEQYYPITDTNGLIDFVEELNKTTPLLRTANSDPIGSSRNNESFRELIIQLNDGTKVTLKLMKGSFIYYGHMGAYFKMNDEQFAKMWSKLE